MKHTEGKFKSFDGNEIFYREWSHEDIPWNGKILLILHRGHEHSKRLNHIASQKAFEGYKILSYDNRGHGYTNVEAAYEFMHLVRDLDSFVSFLCKKYTVTYESFFIIANSVAGVTATTWIHDYAPNIRGVALIAPAFRIKLYFPFAKLFLKAAIRLKPDLNITSYVKSKFLTHNVEEQKKYDSDAHITPNIPARQLTTLLDTAQRVVKDAHLMNVPTLVISAGKDYVVDSAIQGDFYATLSSDQKKFVTYENFYHGVLYEEGYEKVIDEIGTFMQTCFAKREEKKINELVKLTKKEQEKIAYGSLPLHKSFNYAIQQFMMKSLGRLSKGIQIGLKYGFDSGVTLDHVYKNKPEGITWLGRIIDKSYLNAIGWKGIRQRKVHMINAIEEKIKQLISEGHEVSILDIAGGPARYLVEIAEKYPEIKIQVRDYQEQNVREGKTLASEKNLKNITYEQCDAFDPLSYKSEDLHVNIVIISGIFELFSDNALIINAIKGVASIIEDNGYLLYTGQPWHPQLEQIAHVLGDHQGGKWIMRRRSQYELDHLFEQYGFQKESMQIDDWGIFTVSSAQK